MLLPVGTSSDSQQTLMCWNTLVGPVRGGGGGGGGSNGAGCMWYEVCVDAWGQAMDATQWAGAGAANALPMATALIDARALQDKRDVGHEYV